MYPFFSLLLAVAKYAGTLTRGNSRGRKKKKRRKIYELTLVPDIDIPIAHQTYGVVEIVTP